MSDKRELFAVEVKFDNEGAISLSKNTADNNRAKNTDVQYHFTREKVELGKVDLKFCPTRDMVPDTLTKPLLRAKFDQFRKSLRLQDYYRLPFEGK